MMERDFQMLSLCELLGVENNADEQRYVQPIKGPLRLTLLKKCKTSLETWVYGKSVGVITWRYTHWMY